MKYLYTFLLFAVTCSSFAQNTLRPNIVRENMNYYNAGVSLSDSAFDSYAFVYFKNKYIPKENKAIWNKPVNVYLNYIEKINEKSFFNISYIRDGYSFYNRNIIYGGYGRKFNAGKQGKLSAGARAVININHINQDKSEQLQNMSGKKLSITPDLDLGIQYQWKKLQIGVSGKNLLAGGVKKDNEVIIKDRRELYVNVTYQFGLFKNKVSLAPYILYVKERDIEVDAGFNVSLFSKVDVSYAFRVFEFRSIYSARVALGKRLIIGAAFDNASFFSDKNADIILGYKF